jgi:hypothetical protein
MVRNYNQYHCKINNFRISPTGELKGWDRFCNVAVKSRLEQTNQKKEKAPEMHAQKRREGQFTLQRSDKASRIEIVRIDLFCGDV